MRFIVFISLTICFLLSCTCDSSAFWWKWKTQAPELTEEEKEKTQELKEARGAKQEKKEKEKAKKLAEEARARQRELKKEKRQQLNNTEWKIELSVFGNGKTGKKDYDVITFKDNQVISEKLNREGFSSTNYTLTIKEDGTLVWETMQTSDRSGIAFWRGELDTDLEKMSGILSRRIDEKTTKDYHFHSTTKKNLPVTSQE